MLTFDQLPNDIIDLLMTFLDYRERAALLVAFSNEFFPHRELLLKRQLNISRCYFMGSPLGLQFLNNVPFHRLRVFNVSHCYWLSADLLIRSIPSMIQLEELVAHDTQLTFIHLPPIFKCCTKITKLSISIAQETWDDFNQQIVKLYGDEGMQRTKNAVRRLTHLKLIGMNASSCKLWLLVLRILGWCINCVDIHLEPFYTDDYLDRPPAQRTQHVTKPIQEARNDLFGQLKWMANLKSLVFTRRGDLKYCDRLMEHLFNWLFRELNFTDIERLWLNMVRENVQFDKKLPDSLRSVKLGPKLKIETCHQLTHVGGIRLPPSPDSFYAPGLKHFHGTTSFEPNVADFCRRHPDLECLILDTSFGSLGSDWHLPKLRTLSYRCSVLTFCDLQMIIDACPKMDELHLEFANHETHFRENCVRLQNIKKLKINGNIHHQFFELLFLKSNDRWTHLESLHLSVNYLRLPDPFPADFPTFTQAARSLRDFRFQFKGNDLLQVAHILRAIRQCYNLERLVVHREEGTCLKNCRLLDPDFVVELVSSSERLVVLCLVDNFDATAIQNVTLKLKNVILPWRPSFWFHLGSKLPQPDHVPRVHFDEIVNPSPYSILPPLFS